MDASISIQVSIETIEAIINASPVASLVADSSGRVICSNQAARDLFGLDLSSHELNKLFVDDSRLAEALDRARRSSGTVPTVARTRQEGHDLRLDLRALPEPSGRPPKHLLITAVTRELGNRRMLELKQRLQNVAAEKRRLRDANEQLREKVETTIPRLKRLTTTDPLTGVFNRRFFDKRFKREWNRARRQGGMLALVYVDIDHFKAYNDTLGHPEGDACLKQVADALQSAVTREFDCVCRIGGEEFALLLPMTSERGAIEVGQRVLSAVRALALPHPRSPERIVTVSVGIGTCQPDLESDRSELVAQVDAALYRAKESGRDRMERVRGSLPHCPDEPPGTNRSAPL